MCLGNRPGCSPGRRDLGCQGGLATVTDAETIGRYSVPNDMACQVHRLISHTWSLLVCSLHLMPPIGIDHCNRCDYSQYLS